ncbi:MAG TPA: asparagine synthase (glutamine-hydrolyzing), partial [Polyangiaceae bacterium]|nr:asparagine synthase (glutamine-hydrolyzing) [Polyangiaceae bacterium]
IINLKAAATPTPEELERMILALRHRGPDQLGYLLDDGVGLAHARLSIVDVSGGSQPLCNETEDVWIVYNGEVFNYPELRAELQAQGHVFRTSSATEVLVHAYEQHGDDFVKRLNGQFAFALWDARRRRLLLCRDPVGIAPLFYTTDGERLYFASEIKALLRVAPRPARLDAAALDQVLTFWAPIAPRTPFEGIRQLAPAERMVVQGGRTHLERYWQLDYPARGEHPLRDAETAMAEIARTLASATELRLRSDVPVAAYLSGGFDSATIAALALKAGASLKTFSLTFDDALLDESPYQQRMVRWLDTEHDVVSSRGADLWSLFEDAVWHAEAPLVRSAPLPMLQLSRAVHDAGYRVVLTGEGADEFFAGYDLFKELKIRRSWARRPESRSRSRLLEGLYPYLARSPAKAAAFARSFFAAGLGDVEAPLFSHMTRMAATARAKTLFSKDLAAQLQSGAQAEFLETLPSDFRSWDALNRAQYLEATLLLPGYLLASQGERMLMASSVEGRFPFLDPNLIALSTRIDPRLLMCGLREKSLLKRSFAELLPSSILRRSKQPYRAPSFNPFHSTARAAELARELLSPALLDAYGYFDSAKVSWLLRKTAPELPLSESDSMALSAVLTTQYLHQRFITGLERAPSRPTSACILSTISRRPRVAA